MAYTPEELAALRAERNAALENLRINDPILWAILIQQRGDKALAELFAWPLDQVRARIMELHKAKRITKKRYMGHIVFAPHPKDLELKRLCKRAQNIKFNNQKQLTEERKKE